MPTVHIAMKIPSNFGLTAFRNMITDGSESVVSMKMWYCPLSLKC